jgi:hypothetical protein
VCALNAAVALGLVRPILGRDGPIKRQNLSITFRFAKKTHVKKDFRTWFLLGAELGVVRL